MKGILIIGLLLTVLALWFAKVHRPTCDISDFLRNRKNKGTCTNNLKALDYCKVPCEDGSEDGDISVSCSITGKTKTKSTCDSS